MWKIQVGREAGSERSEEPNGGDEKEERRVSWWICEWEIQAGKTVGGNRAGRSSRQGLAATQLA